MEKSLERLYSSGLKFLTPLTLDKTYKTVVKEAMKLVNAQYGSIFEYQKGKLERVYASNRKLYKIKIRTRGYNYRAYKMKQPVVLKLSQTEKIHPKIKDMGIKSTILIPLIYRDTAFGMLAIDTFNDREFTKNELQIIKHFASMATLAIKKSQLYTESEKSVRERDLFISIASHELKNPLASISLISQILRKKMDKTNPQIARMAYGLNDEVRRLNNLIDDFLELNKIKKGEFSFKWGEISLKSLLDRIKLNFESVHPKRDLVIENKVVNDKKIKGDLDKLLQVVMNILNNAVKFSKKEKKVRLTVKELKGFVSIEISDEGTGIDKKDLKKIFEEFYKGSNTGKGMGLGLYLAKNIIDAHKGKISVSSHQGKGSTFFVLLPLKEGINNKTFKKLSVQKFK